MARRSAGIASTGAVWAKFSAGVVLDSVVIRALEMQNRVHPDHDPSRFGHLTHHVVLLKECVVEVVAEAVSVQRFEGTRLDAVTAAMGG